MDNVQSVLLSSYVVWGKNPLIQTMLSNEFVAQKVFVTSEGFGFVVRGESPGCRLFDRAEKLIPGKVSTSYGVRTCDRWHQVPGA